MKHGSLFSGIGGFDLAAERMGWENAFHCEINPFCQQILKHYWPNATQYHDITKTDFTIWKGSIDILTGGFPCQPFSHAGSRKGTEDERHLWPEYLRAIREIQPPFVIGENVAGLASMGVPTGSTTLAGEDLAEWLEDGLLASICQDLEKEGYQVQTFNIPAAAVNAPHERQRLWIVAHAGHTKPSGRKQIKERQQLKRRRAAWSESPPHGSLLTTTNPTASNDWRNIGELEGGQMQQLGNGIEPGDITDSKSTKRQRSSDSRNRGYGPANENSKFITHAHGVGPWGESNGNGEPRFFNQASPTSNWQNFPTQSPVCSGNDGLSARLDREAVFAGIDRYNPNASTYNRWRRESIKGGGNAIVPQVAYGLFKAIEETYLK